jgi:hypothetical protein
MASNGSYFPQEIQVPKSKAASSYWVDCGKPKRGYRYLRRRSSCAAAVPTENNKAATTWSPGGIQCGIIVSSLIHHDLPEVIIVQNNILT